MVSDARTLAGLPLFDDEIPDDGQVEQTRPRPAAPMSPCPGIGVPATPRW